MPKYVQTAHGWGPGVWSRVRKAGDPDWLVSHHVYMELKLTEGSVITLQQHKSFIQCILLVLISIKNLQLEAVQEISEIQDQFA